MARDLTVTGFEDRPGINAAIGEALGRVGVNIEGTFGSGSFGQIHVLGEDVDAARRAIEEAGFEVGEARDVLVLGVENRPGAWGEIARRIADEGVNIAFHYIGSGNRLVIADLERARAVV